MSQPIRLDTISIALCLSKIMPISEADQDWSKWTQHHLRDAVALCIKVDPNAAYHHVPEELLYTSIDEGQGEGKAFLLDVLDKAKKGVPNAVLALIDQEEPEDSEDEDDYGVEYENWHGYDGSLRGFEAACNYEDYWKDGGREGIATGKQAHERQSLNTWLNPTWCRAFDAIHDNVNTLADWAEFAKTLEKRCRLLKAKLAEFGKSSKWDESTKGAGAADQLYALPPVVAESILQDALLLAAARLISRGNGHPNAANYCVTLLQLMEDRTKTRYEFGAQMKAFARKSVHELCAELDLKSASEGEGRDRHLVVRKH